MSSYESDTGETFNLDLPKSPNDPIVESPEESPKSGVSRLKWTLFFFACLIFFMFLKMPTDRLADVVVAKINQSIPGLSLTAEEADFSLLFRKLSLEKVKIRYQSYSGEPINLPLDELVVEPRILPLILKKVSSQAWLSLDGAEINIDFSANANQELENFDLEIEDLSLAALMKHLGSMTKGLPQIKGLLNAKAEFSGNPQNLNDIFGRIDVELEDLSTGDISIPLPQMGAITLPALKIGPGNAQISMGEGKVLIKKLELGKPGNDLVLKISGSSDLQPGRPMDSNFDLEVRMQMSEALKSAIPAMDLLMKPYKEGNEYAFRLKGNRSFAMPSKLK